MRRLGLVEEGTYRKHMVTERGEVRDTVYFSVVDDEWPAMKGHLEGMLARA
jgi:RimJ/RimL family protein N-acetyltransferase